jgi:hypothetical protein
MATDHNDIYTIVERLRMLEEGLDTDQKSTNQLSATFRPKTVSVLTAKKDPKNPMAGKLVGGCEESIEDEDRIQPKKDRTTIASEGAVAEDVIDKVKNSFVDYLKSIEDKYRDSHLKDKKQQDTDLKKKTKQDRDLVTKENREIDPPEFDSEVEEDSELGSALSGEIPAAQPPGEPGVSIKESAAVKTVTNECGLWEMHGNEHAGFEVRRSGRGLPTRFKTLDDAEMAIRMFAHRRRGQDDAEDYVDEA